MAEVKWYEVSLTVSPELAESVAEVIGRFTGEGVVLERAVEYNDAEDEGTPYGPVKVYGYLVVSPQLEETRQRLEEAFWHLSLIQPVPERTYKPIQDENWMASWKEHYHPIPVGERLLVLPAWLESNHPERIAVKIDPSMAFGTGTHPTTQLCMEMIERHLQPGQPVIDVGCGSGILSVAALLLGARHALAVDIDAAAVRSTRENAVANGVAEGVEIGLGSVNEVRAGQFSLRQAPFVVANILAPVIIRLLDAGLADLVEPGGLIVFSGILAPQAADVDAAARARGLTFIEKRQQEDWVALLYRRD